MYSWKSEEAVKRTGTPPGASSSSVISSCTIMNPKKFEVDIDPGGVQHESTNVTEKLKDL